MSQTALHCCTTKAHMALCMAYMLLTVCTQGVVISLFIQISFPVTPLSCLLRRLLIFFCGETYARTYRKAKGKVSHWIVCKVGENRMSKSKFLLPCVN